MSSSITYHLASRSRPANANEPEPEPERVSSTHPIEEDRPTWPSEPTNARYTWRDVHRATRRAGERLRDCEGQTGSTRLEEAIGRAIFRPLARRYPAHLPEVRRVVESVRASDSSRRIVAELLEVLVDLGVQSVDRSDLLEALVSLGVPEAQAFDLLAGLVSLGVLEV